VKGARSNPMARRVPAAIGAIAALTAGGVFLLSALRDDAPPPGSGGRRPRGLFFPTFEYGPGNGFPLALLRGTLVEQDGCLFVFNSYVGGSSSHLVLWPEGYEALLVDGVIEVRDGSGARIGGVGEAVVVGGGEINHLEVGGRSAADRFATGHVGEIPAACRSEHLYWLVSPSH
jgi:hypothetical protein